MARVDKIRPVYCAKHEKKRLRSGACPKCKMTAEEFISPLHKAPVRLLALTVLVFVVGILCIFLFILKLITTGGLEGRGHYYSLGFGILLFFFGIWTIRNLFQIKKRGLIKCASCGNYMYSKAVWCIYCGKYIQWYFPMKWD